MGVKTKLFVTAKREQILDIMPKVIDAINTWQRNRLAEYADRKGFDNTIMFLCRNKEAGVNKDLKDFTNGIYSIDTNDFRTWTVNFTVNGEQRNLWVFSDCSSDYSDTYDGDKIIFSLGAWGLSHEIMMVVAEAVKEFGDVYYVYDDCSEDFRKLEFEKES